MTFSLVDSVADAVLLIKNLTLEQMLLNTVLLPCDRNGII
jgi:hypothetical protein